jgi:hypothetical protein
MSRVFSAQETCSQAPSPIDVLITVSKHAGLRPRFRQLALSIAVALTSPAAASFITSSEKRTLRIQIGSDKGL